MSNSSAGPEASSPPVGSGAGNAPGTAALAMILRTYSDRWEIRPNGILGYMAIKRSDALTVVTGLTLDELDRQLKDLP